MGYKRNKYSGKQPHDKQNLFQEPKKKKNKPAYQPQQSVEELIEQILIVQQLLSLSRDKLNKSQHHCYLLSTSWFRSWKQYAGYDAFNKGEDPQKTNMFRKVRPDKANEDIIDKQPQEYMELPEDLQEYAYLNVGVDQSAELNKEFMLIDADLWYFFESKYTGYKIMRPVKRAKGKARFDVDLLEIRFVILSDPEILQIKETDDEYYKANYNDMVKILKQQVPSFWTMTDLRAFIIKYLKAQYKFQGNPDSVDIWKFQNFIPDQQIKMATAQTIRKGKYNFMGRILSQQEKKQYELSDFLKSSYVLFIRFGEITFNKIPIPALPITGNCETCLQKHKLEASCSCKQVLYCSKACAAEDKSFHQKICDLAYDSDDDEQYKKKVEQPKDSKCGLINLGNTCYMNASLQCLLNVPAFAKLFLAGEFEKQMDEKMFAENKGVFLNKFAKFVKKYQEYEVLSPWSLKTQINQQMSAFRGYDQHDSSQFILSLLNTINDFLAKDSKQHGYAKLFVDTLLGSFESTILCPDCNVESKSKQAFLSVSLPIKPKLIVSEYNYVIIDAWNKYRKGSVSTELSWHEIEQTIGLKPGLRRMVGVEGSELDTSNSDDTIMQIATRHPKQSVIIYDLKPVEEGCVQIQVNLAHMQNQAKNHYGYPIFISTPLANSLYEIYLQLADIVGVSPQAKLELETFIVKTIQKLENAQNEKAVNRLEEAVQEEFQEKISPLLGFEVLIVNNRKQKKACVFCHRKCAWCVLPFSFNKTVEDYVALGHKAFRLELVFSKQVDLAVQETKSSNKVNQNTTLEQCIDQFHKPQKLDEDNFWFCMVCEAPKLATKLITISQLPKVIMLHIKRFKDEDHRIKVKDNEPVSYPEVLNVAGVPYKFNSAIIHEGSLEGGHYWAICRKSEGYYIFNDETYKQTDSHFNNNAYILFYEQA